MSDTDLFVGPAVVVDDKIDDDAAGMTAVVDQIRSAGLPVVSKTELPPEEEIRHWRGFSLIILDWELVPTGGEVGVKLPDALQEANADQVAAFVERLLSELYCPVFIITNQEVDEVRGQLADRLKVGADQMAARVLVKSKAAVADGLFAELTQWVKDHPAVYALKCWELGYHDARRQLFEDFELSSGSWPRILWRASEEDGVNPHFELTETISRNVLHRFEPLVFDLDVLTSKEGQEDPPDALRSVIHRRAVVPPESLHLDVLMPGDFFAARDGDESELLINVTPACDLVARDQEPDAIRMTVLRSTEIPAEDYAKVKDRDRLLRPPAPTNEVLWVLWPTLRPYRVDFKAWSEITWGDYKHLRLGRLLEPYIVNLQQRFALHFHRQGLPRLPKEFYENG